MSVPVSVSGPDIETLLAAHLFLPTTEPYGWCSCGASTKRVDHRAHVAAVLRAHIVTWLESEAAHKAVALAIAMNNPGGDCGFDDPLWLNDAKAALAALVGQIGADHD